MTRQEALQQMANEEQAYWRIRDSLLDQYRGKFVPIVNGEVVASGDQMSKVSAAAYRTTGSKVKFVTLVGEEDFEFVIRQTSGRFIGGSRYELPVVDASVSDLDASQELIAQFVVDTGADISILAEPSWSELELWRSPAGFASIRGIAGPAERRAMYDATIRIGGYAVDVAVDVRDDLAENILSRDVINEFALSLCAKRNQIIFDWVD
jgi:hypothetical protein